MNDESGDSDNKLTYVKRDENDFDQFYLAYILGSRKQESVILDRKHLPLIRGSRALRCWRSEGRARSRA